MFLRLRWEVNKVALAQELLPRLISKLKHDHDEDHPKPPVIHLTYDLYARAAPVAWKLSSPDIDWRRRQFGRLNLDLTNPVDEP